MTDFCLSSLKGTHASIAEALQNVTSIHCLDINRCPLVRCKAALEMVQVRNLKVHTLLLDSNVLFAYPFLCVSLPGLQVIKTGKEHVPSCHHMEIDCDVTNALLGFRGCLDVEFTLDISNYKSLTLLDIERKRLSLEPLKISNDCWYPFKKTPSTSLDFERIVDYMISCVTRFNVPKHLPFLQYLESNEQLTDFFVRLTERLFKLDENLVLEKGFYFLMPVSWSYEHKPLTEEQEERVNKVVSFLGKLSFRAPVFISRLNAFPRKLPENDLIVLDRLSSVAHPIIMNER